jgi:toxin ParE1/3/4
VAELDLSAAARADLVDIRIFSLEPFGPEVADRYFRGFAAAFALLADHPLAGAARPEIGNRIRCFTHRKHRIFYVVDAHVVLIVRILHHATDAGRVFKQ